MIVLTKDSRKIPLKNYIYMLLIIVLSIAILYYLYLWFIEYNKEQQRNSVIASTMQVININELNTYLIENKNAIIYISTTNNNDIRKYEKKLEKLIKKENITNTMLYMDVTSKLNKSNQFELENKKISVPAFLVYEDSNLVEVYEIDKKFNIDQTEKFLIEKEVINND